MAAALDNHTHKRALVKISLKVDKRKQIIVVNFANLENSRTEPTNDRLDVLNVDMV